MSMVPMNDRDGLSPFRGFQLNQAQRRRELRVLNHGLDMAEAVTMDLIDSQALNAASRVAFDEELNFLRYGISLVGTSVAGQELLARRVNLLSNINTGRINRKFGS